MSCPRCQTGPLAYAAFPREPVSLRRLFPSASFVGCADIRVRRITQSPEESTPGILFMPPAGDEKDQAALAARAVRYGASSLLVSRPVAGLPVPQCVVRTINGAFGRVCGALADEPLRRLRAVGIAGTGGGTVAAGLIQEILTTNGHSCQAIQSGEKTAENTNPPLVIGRQDAQVFWQSLAGIPRQGSRFATLDLTDDRFDLEWIGGARLEVAGITRLDSPGEIRREWIGRETIDLIRPGGTLVINRDDPAQASLAAHAPNHVRVVSTSLQQPANITASGIVPAAEGTRLVIAIGKRRLEVGTRLTGSQNLSQCLMAVAVLNALGLDPDEIADGLRHLSADAAARNPGENACAPVP